MSSRRRKIRELAMQVLFVWDANGQSEESLAHQVIAEETDDAAKHEAIKMAKGAWDQREMIDARIEAKAPQWPPRRQPAVDRNILRLAVWELTNLPTPPKVVIDEAIELAKEFSTEQSSSFINGVLDAILKEHQALVEGSTPGAT